MKKQRSRALHRKHIKSQGVWRSSYFPDAHKKFSTWLSARVCKTTLNNGHIRTRLALSQSAPPYKTHANGPALRDGQGFVKMVKTPRKHQDCVRHNPLIYAGNLTISNHYKDQTCRCYTGEPCTGVRRIAIAIDSM
jgi:hypothetical protein